MWKTHHLQNMLLVKPWIFTSMSPKGPLCFMHLITIPQTWKFSYRLHRNPIHFSQLYRARNVHPHQHLSLGNLPQSPATGRAMAVGSPSASRKTWKFQNYPWRGCCTNVVTSLFEPLWGKCSEVCHVRSFMDGIGILDWNRHSCPFLNVQKMLSNRELILVNILVAFALTHALLSLS